MSFSSEVKKELCRIPLETERDERAVLSGIVGSAGTIYIKSEKLELLLITENASLCSFIYRSFKKKNINPRVHIKKMTHKGGRHIYQLEVNEDGDVRKILKDLRLLKEKSSGQNFYDESIPGYFLSKQSLIKTYIRGVFLAIGYIADPEKSYHLEMCSKHLNYLDTIKNILMGYGMGPKLIRRKNMWVLYLKDSETISDFLCLIGAHKALLSLENVRIIKEIRNDTNRIVNCDTANIDKAMVAAGEQLKNINIIKDTIGLNALPPKLLSLAVARLQNPDLPLKQLGETISPSVSKSGVYRGFQKIEVLAKKHDRNLRNVVIKKAP